MRAVLPRDVSETSAWSDAIISRGAGWIDVDVPRTRMNMQPDPLHKMMAQTTAGADFPELRAFPAVALLRGRLHLVRVGRDTRIAGDAFCIRNKSMVFVKPRSDSLVCCGIEKFLPSTVS